MDLINPKDYRDPIASARADARLPILLVDGIFLLGPVTLEGVLIPKAEVNEFPLPDSPWEPKGLKSLKRSAESGEIILSPGEEPDDWFKDSEFALRVSTVTGGFDLALLYYNGYTDDPVYHRDFLTDGKMRFTPRYHRYQRLAPFSFLLFCRLCFFIVFFHQSSKSFSLFHQLFISFSEFSQSG